MWPGQRVRGMFVSLSADLIGIMQVIKVVLSSK